MTTISDPAIRGSGLITHAFPSPDGNVLAIASRFSALVNPRSRACYAGQTLHYRLALHRRGEAVPFAAFDRLRFHINDVAFHPTEPVVAIATGSYDGGYFFEGDLVLWNWIDDLHGRPVAQIPEVVRCRFDESGKVVESLVRPWDEEWEGLPEPREDTAFDSLFPVRVSYSGAAFAGTHSVQIELMPGARLERAQVVAHGFAEIAISDADEAESRALSWFNLTHQKMRHAIRDVCWLDDQHLAVVHDGCVLEIFDMAGDRTGAFYGEGFGSEILKSTPPCVHIVEPPPLADRYSPQRGVAKLCAISNGELTEVGSFEGEYTFSSTPSGHILGRLNRIPAGNSTKDVLLDLAGSGEAKKTDLGHYDCFNHYIGIDGAPYLFFLQGTPQTSHKDKRLCVVQPTGAVRTLWPLLAADGTNASHAMECCGCFVGDGAGEGVVVSGRHYDPNPSRPVAGFIYRKALGADRELWRHGTDACASAIAFVPDEGLIAAALLDGTLMLLRAADGHVLFTGKARVDGVRTIIFCMDANRDRLAIGTVDGRIAVISVKEMLKGQQAEGWLDLR